MAAKGFIKLLEIAERSKQRTLGLPADGQAVEHWMDTHRPDVVAIERVFANANANTAMGTAQAGGVIALQAALEARPSFADTRPG